MSSCVSSTCPPALDVEEASNIEEPGFLFDSGSLLLALADGPDSALAPSSALASSGRWLLFMAAPSFVMSFEVVVSVSALLKSIARGFQVCFLLLGGIVAQYFAMLLVTESKVWTIESADFNSYFASKSRIEREKHRPLYTTADHVP